MAISGSTSHSECGISPGAIFADTAEVESVSVVSPAASSV